MKIRYFQKGFNYSQDGTGNRFVVHLQGCNLRCPWCSNPEGLNTGGGTETSTTELVDEICSCKRLFFDGGGVTFTGGECTLQKSALIEVLEGCKKSGVHTAIETNGTCVFDQRLFSAVDLVICDFKHYDNDKLESVVGKVGDYKKNIRDYIESGKKVLIRTVLINGFNAQKSDAVAFAEFFKGLPTDNVEFEFLAYHEYGKRKWERLNLPYKMQDAFITEETVKCFEQVYAQYNLKTIRS